MSDILSSTPMRDAQTLSRPPFAMPKSACDSHVHVFGPAHHYAAVDKPHYTLPDGTLLLLERMTRTLGIERFAIVQPSYYGTDNRCMVDALARLGQMARGVAMVDEHIGNE